MESEIHVLIVNECIPCWRPVLATKVTENVYLLGGENVDRTGEEWEFPPGSRVEVEERVLSGDFGKSNKVLVAISKHESPDQG